MSTFHLANMLCLACCLFYLDMGILAEKAFSLFWDLNKVTRMFSGL